MARWVEALNRTYPSALFGGVLLLCAGYFLGGLPLFYALGGLELFILGLCLGRLPKRIILLAACIGIFCAIQILRFDVQCERIIHSPEARHIEIECVAEESLLTGNDAHTYMPYPTQIRARITCTFQNGIAQAADTPILLNSKTLAAQLPPTSYVHYGDTLQLKGVLKQPQPVFMPKTFDYRAYLIRHNRFGVFYTLAPDSTYDAWDRATPGDANANAAIVSRDATSIKTHFMRGILTTRDTLLERMTYGLEVAHKRYIASLIFGLKQGLDDLKLPLIQGGLIHLFAVSGLHVGMAALILYFMFFYLPLTTRMAVMIGGLWLYVLTTGMEPAACRAFFMLALYFILTARAYQTYPAQAVLLIGSLMIAFSPRLVTDIGFAFSFVLTLLIVLYARAFSHLHSLLSEKKFWQMRSVRAQKAPAYLKILEAYLLALLMVVGAAPLSLYMNGYTHLLAWVLNPLLIPGIFLVFGLSLIKIVLPLCCHSGIAWCIDAFFRVFSGICDWIEFEFESYAFHMDTETYWLFGLWLILVLLLKIRTAKHAFVLLGGTTMIGLAILIIPTFCVQKTGDLLLFRGANATPYSALVFYTPTRSAYYINPTSNEYERSRVEESARRHGFPHIVHIRSREKRAGIRMESPETDTPLSFSVELPHLTFKSKLIKQNNQLCETLEREDENHHYNHPLFCGERLLNQHTFHE